MIRDMTKGNIYNHIVQFSIPIILGNIFQLTYNAVDSIIVGKFAGTNALAAVGTSDPIINILILGISGICIGASVLISEFFGAKIYEDIKNVTNIDFSESVIKLMQEHFHENQIETKCLKMDVMDMSDFRDSEFNVVFDKALLDSILCGENALDK